MLLTALMVFIAIMVIICNFEILGRVFEMLIKAVFAPFIAIGRLFGGKH